MTRTVLVVGAGPIGQATAKKLARIGDQVRLVSRSGSGPESPGIERVVADAATAQLTDLAAGADVIVNATNLPYHRWQADWPALNRSFMRAAAASGADLVLIGNYYGYPAGVCMSPDLPLQPPTRKGAVRAEMWRDLLAEHRAGRFRALELRASDYIGPEALATPGAHGGNRLVRPVLANRAVRVLGDPDAPHTWTAVGDIARSVAELLDYDQAWGRAWHVPTAAARSIRQLAADIAAAGGARPPQVKRLPTWMLRVFGVAAPQARELVEMTYQFDRPFLSDDTELTRLLDLEPTTWERSIETTVAAARAAADTD